MLTVSQEFITDLKDRVLLGQEITLDEALQLIEIENEELLSVLHRSAREITHFFNSNQAHLCSLINAKSYMCGEDCAFCSQSARFNTNVERYDLLSPEEILKAAKKVEASGVNNFCIVTSGGSLNDKEFEQIIDTVQLLKRETKLNIDGSLGFLTPEKVQRLQEAGMRRFNDNLQTSRDFYSKIVSTHTYDTRLQTLDFLKQEGMDLCSGGILGMGETREDRVRMAFDLKKYQPECVPVNVLNPRPGTPLENAPKVETKEIIKTIAVFRFILPKSNIKLAGGREVNLGTEQLAAFKAGANGVVTGGYLTTQGNSFETDKELLKAAGYEIASD